MSDKLKKYLAELQVITEEKIVRTLRTIALNKMERACEISDKEQEKYFKTISAIMRQNRTQKPTKDPETGEKMNSFAKVRWMNLAPNTQYRKERIAGAGFRNVKWVSGERNPESASVPLHAFLRQMSPSNYFSKTSARMVQSGSAKNPKFRIFIHPGLIGSMGSFNMGDNSFREKNQDRKINAKDSKGRTNEQKRPIFTPMREYYVRQRIPRIINETLKKEGYGNVQFK